MTKKVRLTAEQVRAYEKMSGFKTNGDVVLELSDDKVFDILYETLTPTPKEESVTRSLPQPFQCKCGDYHFPYDPEYKHEFVHYYSDKPLKEKE